MVFNSFVFVYFIGVVCVLMWWKIGNFKKELVLRIIFIDCYVYFIFCINGIFYCRCMVIYDKEYKIKKNIRLY